MPVETAYGNGNRDQRGTGSLHAADLLVANVSLQLVRLNYIAELHFCFHSRIGAGGNQLIRNIIMARSHFHVTPSRKSHAIKFHWSGTWLSRGSYGVYVSVTGCT